MTDSERKLPDELIDLANARSRRSGENSAEELLNLMLEVGLVTEENTNAD